MKRLVAYVGPLLALAGWYFGGTPVHGQPPPHESGQEACIRGAQWERRIATERDAGLTRDVVVEQMAQISPDLPRGGIQKVVSGIFADSRSPEDLENDVLTRCLSDVKPAAITWHLIVPSWFPDGPIDPKEPQRWKEVRVYDGVGDCKRDLARLLERGEQKLARSERQTDALPGNDKRPISQISPEAYKAYVEASTFTQGAIASQCVADGDSRLKSTP